MSFRIGVGYDIHQLVEGRKLVLGGIEIPHPKGLLGHSDADCLIHALVDSILGAAGLRDIGQYFPDDDPQNKDRNSKDFLLKAKEEIQKLGYSIVNLDSTLIAQSPKLNPYIDAMKANLASVLDLDPSQIGIKATTNEKLDAIGSHLAIAAHAVCLIQKSA